jgi:phosphate transport system ATP-binding protein
MSVAAAGLAKPMTALPVTALIDTLKRSITTVLVTHNLAQAARCADKVAFLYLGTLVECGTAGQIFTAPLRRETQAYVTGRLG